MSITPSRSLGTRWFTRGVRDLKKQRFQTAVSELRTALLYSRDNYPYQLNLAEALLGEGRRDEASAYLVNLWEREPENGQVNLDLAYIAVQKGENEQALRYYHNAIYATWPGNQEGQRRDTRLKLIEFLLGIHDKTQVQSELIALAANLANDPSEHAWEEHWKRLRASAAALHLDRPFEPGRILGEIARTASAHREASGHTGELYVRLQISRGGGPIGLDIALADRPDFVLLVQPCPELTAEKARDGLNLSLARDLRRNPADSLNPAWKTGNYLNNLLCLREARARGADEVVILIGQ